MPDQDQVPKIPAARQALARRYRPRRFADIALQEHVSETLRGAVARGRVAHGYLFAGPRGVGKTTAARVLAMALNCPERTADGEPCGECDSCDRIWAGKTSLDVVEIDAASNRGVDDARELRERAMYAPTDDRRYKVYIIDEAHMLTREAWNALLKILEEPPPRVVFIFATTEPQKIQQVASPVLSRCQRFDFRRMTTGSIVETLRRVLASEGIEAGDDALVPIARHAEGGMRDALSLLDQVLALSDRRLSGEDVRRVLGLVGDEVYLELFRILADGRSGAVFSYVQRVVDQGYDLAEFYRGLIDALRTLLLVKLDGPETGDIREDLRAEFEGLGARFAVGDLLRMLAQTAELDADGRFRKSGNPRVALELLLLRFAYLERTVEIEEIVRALGGGSMGSPSAGQEVKAAPPRTLSVGRREAVAPVVPAPEPAPTAAPPLESAPASAPVGRPADPPASAPSRVERDAGEGAWHPTGDSGAGHAASAFRAVIDEDESVPAGLRVLLRAARVSEPEPGRVVIDVPPGPVWERLNADAAACQALRDGLVARLGRELDVELREARDAFSTDEAPVPMTPERLRRERLAKLRSEPGIGAAIEAWDLDLVD